MIDRVRIPFLNWQPDKSDLPNEGLEDCDNVVHEPEGYKPVFLESAGAFATTGALTNVASIVVKTVGPSFDKFHAWLDSDQIKVGINGVEITSSGSTTVSFATSGSNQAICFFDVAEFGDEILFTVEAQQDQATPATTVSIRLTGRTTDAALG